MLSAVSQGVDRRWWPMLALSALIVSLSLLYKMHFNEPVIQYTHLLVTYHFGFVKRALMGELVSLFIDRVPVSAVYVIGVSAWLVAVLLFVAAFKRSFGLTRANLPLFVLIAGSPFFFKNFMYTVGYFDIYGCILALAALLLPAGVFYPFILAAGCVVLILIHPIHMLLYCPVVALILTVRHYLPAKFSLASVAYGSILAVAILAVFVASVFFGQMPVPPETWSAYVQSRATVPLDPHVSYIWYSTIREEITRTWTVMGNNALRFPVFAVLIALHLPVIRCFRSQVRALANPLHRRVVVSGLGAVCASYLIIGCIVFDYARWVSNWAVCMFLSLLAVRMLPSTADSAVSPVAANDKQALTLGWILTLIPRVGITKPF